MDEPRETTPTTVAAAAVVVTVVLLLAAALATSPVASAGAPGDGDVRESGRVDPHVDRGGAVDRAAGARSGIASTDVTQPDPPADTLVTRIRLHANGSATWVIEIRTQITNQTDVEDYQRFQRQFRNDTGEYIGSFRERIVRLVETAGNATDRPMRADSFTASTRIEGGPRQYGVVEYRFRWTGFAVERDGGLAVGDVFESGYYLSADELMTIDAPAGQEITTVTPTPETRDDEVVGWSGPLDFGDGRPSVRTVDTDVVTTAGADAGTDAAPATDSPTLSLLGIGVGVLTVGGLAVYLVRRRRPHAHGDEDESGGRPSTTDDPPVGTDDEPGEGDGDGPAGDETLLTDEERVVTLLERNGGRMRQGDIADELGWSASKTSRTLSSMDGEEIEKFRLGNENVIDLIEEE